VSEDTNTLGPAQAFSQERRRRRSPPHVATSGAEDRQPSSIFYFGGLVTILEKPLPPPERGALPCSLSVKLLTVCRALPPNPFMFERGKMGKRKGRDGWDRWL
jgi:hypothetical protein